MPTKSKKAHAIERRRVQFEGYHQQLFGLGSDSYNRLEVAFDAYRRHWRWPSHRAQCLRLLGDAYVTSDNVARHIGWIRVMLREANSEDLHAMMSSPEDLAAFASLPERVTVYRGCYEHNREGLSWTLDRTIAASFPGLNRYRQPGQPLLVTGAVARERCVYFNEDRNEQEILCGSVEVVSVEALAHEELGAALEAHDARKRTHLEALLNEHRAA